MVRLGASGAGRVQGQRAARFEGCVTNGSENFDQIKFWRTPVAKCTLIGAGCVPYYRWVSDYIAVLGGR